MSDTDELIRKIMRWERDMMTKKLDDQIMSECVGGSQHAACSPDAGEDAARTVDAPRSPVGDVLDELRTTLVEMAESKNEAARGMGWTHAMDEALTQAEQIEDIVELIDGLIAKHGPSDQRERRANAGVQLLGTEE